MTKGRRGGRGGRTETLGPGGLGPMCQRCRAAAQDAGTRGIRLGWGRAGADFLVEVPSLPLSEVGMEAVTTVSQPSHGPGQQYDKAGLGNGPFPCHSSSAPASIHLTHMLIPYQDLFLVAPKAYSVSEVAECLSEL